MDIEKDAHRNTCMIRAVDVDNHGSQIYASNLMLKQNFLYLYCILNVRKVYRAFFCLELSFI